MSGFYNATAAKLLKEFYKKVAHEVVGKVGCGTLLDIGTGPGRLPIEVAKLAPSVKVVGVDISESMVTIARKNVEKEGLSDRIEFRVGDAEALAFRDATFDLIMSTGALHHFHNPLKVFNECHRVLKGGGEAWVYDLRGDATDAEVKLIYGNAWRPPDWAIKHFATRFVRLHGIKPKDYAIGGRVRKALEECAFKRYAVERKGAHLKIVLIKG